jgi:hypothetical protein
MRSSEESAITGSLLPDEEIDNATKFGFDDYSTALASITADKNLQTPFTIAIHGDWGSGKTSLMKTVARKLESPTEGEVGVKTIWFNAWEFEKLSVPLWTIFINRVVMELQEMAQDENLKSKIKAVGEGILRLASGIVLRKLVGVTLKEVEEIKKDVWTDVERVDSLREELSQYLEEALKSDSQKRERLAIFIDDLDRCLPEQAVEVFESIKLFLSCKHCLFIIGVNKEQIRKAFEQKFGAKEGPSGLLYIEKFAQLQFDLPRKTPVEVEEFLREHASQQLKKSPETIKLISQFIEPNPRKIKKWMNSVLFLEKLFRVKQQKLIKPTEIDVSIVSIWVFLKSFFPDFATFTESDLSMLNVAIKVAKGEGTEEDKKKIGDFTIDKRLAEFLSLLQPSFSDDQLKDVVYLSRLTPAGIVSVLPTDILERIAEMNEDELSSQILTLSQANTLSLTDRLIDRLSHIEYSTDYTENRKLYDLLNLLFESSENELLKVELFVRIFRFMLADGYAYSHFSSKLETYTSIDFIKKAIMEKDLLDNIIALFVRSNSYERANWNSATLRNFSDDLTEQQIETIVKASIENNQIYNSWGAQSNLKEIFSKHKDKISEEKRTKIEEALHISL